MSFEGPALSMAAVAGQSGRMAPVVEACRQARIRLRRCSTALGQERTIRPSAMGYGYQESTPFGEVVSGGSSYGVGFDAMAGFGLRAADGPSEHSAGWQSRELHSGQDQDASFSVASSAGFPAGTTDAFSQDGNVAEADRMRIVKAIRGADGDLLLAAELLGVTYAVLRKRMAEIGIRVKNID